MWDEYGRFDLKGTVVILVMIVVFGIMIGDGFRSARKKAKFCHENGPGSQITYKHLGNMNGETYTCP